MDMLIVVSYAETIYLIRSTFNWNVINIFYKYLWLLSTTTPILHMCDASSSI